MNKIFFIISILAITIFGSFAQAKTVSKEVVVNVNGRAEVLKLRFNQKNESTEKIVTFEHFRIEHNGKKLPIFKSFSPGTSAWCRLLGYKYLSYSVVGYTDNEYDDENKGLIIKEDGLTLGKTGSDSLIINFISCTNDKTLEY